MNIRSQVQSTRLAPVFTPRCVKTDRRTPTTIQEHIGAYVRSGAMDTCESEMIAIEQFAREHGMDMRTAEYHWTNHTAPAGIKFA